MHKFCGQNLWPQNDEEMEYLSRCKKFTLNTGIASNIKYIPYMFMAQGVYIFMTVLHGELTIKQSCQYKE